MSGDKSEDIGREEIDVALENGVRIYDGNANSSITQR